MGFAAARYPVAATLSVLLANRRIQAVDEAIAFIVVEGKGCRTLRRRNCESGVKLQCRSPKSSPPEVMFDGRVRVVYQPSHACTLPTFFLSSHRHADMDRYTAMTPSSEGLNPLRPYYKPPSIGVLPDNLPNGSTYSASSATRSSTTPQSFGSSARDLLSDLNYSEILGDAAPTTGDSLKALLDQALWKYSSVFMAQPFEVAKTVLQCHLAGSPGANGESPWRPSSSRHSSVHPGSHYSDVSGCSIN